MSEANSDLESEDMLDEYDFSLGERGNYAARFAEGTNLVLLDPDVAAHFHSQEDVNQCLRLLVKLAQEQVDRAAG